jgi:hypothetical protein
MFRRDNVPIVGRIIKTVTEPLDASKGRQVVFFCQDKAGKRYRVPKTEAVMCGTARKEDTKCKHKKRKKQPRKNYALDGADWEPLGR